MSLSRTLQYLFLIIVTFSVGFSLYQWNASRASTQKTAPNNGLVGYWSFDENTGTQAGDASGNGNTGTLTNGPTWVTGKLGKAVSFDGVDDYVDAGNSASMKPSFPFSVSAWVLLPTGGSSGIITTADIAGPYGEYSGYSVFISTGGVTAQVGSAAGWCSGSYRNSYTTNATTLNTNQWYYVTAVFTNASSFSIFVNGASVTTTQSGTNGISIGYVANVPLRMGRYFAACGATTVTYAAQLDEVRVYNRALSGTEVTNLYNLGAEKLNAVNLQSAPLNGLAGVWSFNSADISGTTVYDRSGNGNNGTLTGGPVATSGKNSQAMSFDGVNDYMDAGTSATLKPSFPFSVSLWVKRATSGQSATVTTGAPGGAGVYSGYTVTVGADISAQIGSGTFDCVPDSRYTMVTSSAPVTVGSWHHVVVIFTAIGNFRAFVDGESVTMNYSSGGAGSMVYDVGCRLRINSIYSCGATSYQTGSVDDVRVYNRELAFSEIQDLANFGNLHVNTAASFRADSSAGLTGYWNLDDNTGTTATDSSVNAKNGTLTNGPTWGTGKIGSDVVFDGTNDYIDLGTTSTAAFNYSGDVSGAAWVKTSTNGRMILLYQNGNPLIYVSVGPTSNGGTANKLVVYLRTNFGSFYLFSGEKTLTDGAWHHVAFSRDTVAKKVLLYVDGAMDGVYPYTDTAAINTSGGTHLISESSTYAFNGEIDDVRMYNRVLSPSEVKELSLLMPADTSLKGYWSFNGKDTNWTSSSAGTTSDLSGNANTGTLTNMNRATSSVSGKLGQGLKFDGVDDYVDLGSSASLRPTGSMSLCAWAPMYHSGNPATPIISNDGNSGAKGYSLYEYSINGTQDAFVFSIASNSTTAYAVASTARTGSNGGVFHVCGVYDAPGQTTQIYVNGTLEGTKTSADGIPASQYNQSSQGNPKIGNRGQLNSYYFTGTLDEVRLYARALSAAEVAALYNSGR